MKSLEGKVAIVTGAGSGIGKEIALHYAREGAKIAVSDIDEAGGEETVELIEGDSGEAIFIKADSSSASDNEELVQRTVKEFGDLHIACNNAGIDGETSPIGEYSVDGWNKVISINLSGVFYGMRYQIPAMLKAGGGAIVNIASILGQVGFKNSSAYVAAKHGVVGLTQNAALEYSAQNICVNAIGPGFIKTPLLDQMDEEVKQQLVALHPIGRLGEPEEVAELVLWLSSSKASFVSGAYFPVDGGYLAR